MADVVVALTPHDEDNLLTCQLAARRFRVPRTVALVNDPEYEELFRRLGVTAPVSAARILAAVISAEAGFDEIIRSIPVAGGHLQVSEITLLPDAPAAGRRLDEIALPEGALIGSILREGPPIVPRGPTQLEAGDRLLLICTSDLQERAVRLLTGEPTR